MAVTPKSHDALLAELKRLRARVRELEKAQETHRQTEATLHRAEAEKRIILQSVPEVICYVNRDLEIQWGNRAAVEASRLPVQSLAGFICYKVWNDRNTPCEGCPVVRCLESGRPETNELTHSDGRTWLLRGFPVYSEDGALLGAVEVVSDVTERRHREREIAAYRERLEQRVEDRTAELAATNRELAEVNTRLTDELADRRRIEKELRETGERAEAANRAKTEFLANMSHEIRTPMTAILGYIDLLSEACPQLCQASRETSAVYHDAIRRNADHLLDVINNILDFSRLEADKLSIETIRFVPERIVDEVVQLLAPLAREKGLDIGVKPDETARKSIESDPMRLRQILVNLVGNAIKFTEAGRIDVGLRIEASADERPMLRIDIEDTGPGVNGPQLERLFRPFEQGDNSTTRRFGGSGLGLAISRRLAELLGGDINVRNRPEGGAVFSLAIAAGAVGGLEGFEAISPQAGWSRKRKRRRLHTATEAARSARERIHEGKVLVAEDGLENQRILAALLKRLGVEVAIAVNGRQAFEMATEAVTADQPYDLVLMDMQMPVWDGYLATRSLRKRGYAGAIVALTAHAMPGDRQRCLEAGCDDYLVKPIDRQRLREVVQRFAGPLP